MYYESRQFEVLLGETLEDITVSGNKEQILLKTTSGKEYLMYHSQSCCESVTVEDVDGDLDDLIGNPILLAEEVIHDGKNPDGTPPQEYQESFTWTFYKLSTIKGCVTIRWYGESNGYYGEEVDFVEKT